MERKQIFFTGPGKAELINVDLPEIKSDEVLTKME